MCTIPEGWHDNLYHDNLYHDNLYKDWGKGPVVTSHTDGH
jgi:hypothetical protein